MGFQASTTVPLSEYPQQLRLKHLRTTIPLRCCFLAAQYYRIVFELGVTLYGYSITIRFFTITRWQLLSNKRFNSLKELASIR